MAAGGRTRATDSRDADVAQLVEHFTRNEGVRGSSLRVGFEEFLQSSLFLPRSDSARASRLATDWRFSRFCGQTPWKPSANRPPLGPPKAPRLFGSKDNSPIKGNLGRDSVGSAKIPAWHEPESQEVHFGRPGEGRRDRLRNDHRHVSPCGRGEAIPTPPLAAGRPRGRQRSRSLARARLLARTWRESQGRTSRHNRRA